MASFSKLCWPKCYFYRPVASRWLLVSSPEGTGHSVTLFTCTEFGSDLLVVLLIFYCLHLQCTLSNHNVLTQDTNKTRITFSLLNNGSIWIAVISRTTRLAVRNILVSLWVSKRTARARRGYVASFRTVMSNGAFCIWGIWNLGAAIAIESTCTQSFRFR